MGDSISSLERLYLQFKADAAASYFVGKYYFAINTGKDRGEFGIPLKESIKDDVQIKMQAANIIPIFHEYIHYIHEISTVIGNIGLGLDVYLKSIFSNYFYSNLNSAEHKGIDKMDSVRFDIFCKLFATKEVINGTVIDRKSVV